MEILDSVIENYLDNLDGDYPEVTDDMIEAYKEEYDQHPEEEYDFGRGGCPEIREWVEEILEGHLMQRGMI
jgi:hypothetical protein